MDSGKYMIDDDMIDELGQVAEDISDDYRNRIIAEEEAKSEQAQAEQQAVDTQADPRNSDTWGAKALIKDCLLYTSPSPRDLYRSRMPSSA